MVSPSELIVGRTYFSLAYEDEKLTRLFIHSLEYKGILGDASSPKPQYLFEFIGRRTSEAASDDTSPQGGDEYVLTEGQLDTVLSFEGLASELLRLSPTNGAWIYDDSSKPIA